MFSFLPFKREKNRGKDNSNTVLNDNVNGKIFPAEGTEVVGIPRHHHHR